MNNGLNITSRVELNNGVKMPWLGLGVFRSKDGGPLERAIEYALKLGYRSFDTASIYQNEAGLGTALKSSDVERKDQFITTKLWNQHHGFDQTLKAFDNSLAKLQTDYIDLYLIHWPVPGLFKESWRALEKLYTEGRVKSIGVSNFMVHHLDDLLETAEIVPALNQIEFHPNLVQQSLLDYCSEKGIRAEAWSPLMKGRVQHIGLLLELGRKYKKSPVQIVLRWNLQKGVVTIPKTVRPERLRHNADIFNFHLSDVEVAKIDRLDNHTRIGPDPDDLYF